MTKAQHKYIFDWQMKYIHGKGKKVVIEESSTENMDGSSVSCVWYLLGFFTFNDINPDGDYKLFDTKSFEVTKGLAKSILKGLSESEPLTETNVLKRIKKDTYHKYILADGSSKWINVKAEKTLPVGDYEYRSSEDLERVFCIKNGIVRGVILTYRMREEDKL